MWKDKDNYDKISVEIYRVMFLEAKERHEDVLSESKIITNKASRLIIAVTAIGTWAVTSIVSFKSNYNPLFLFILLFLIELGLLTSLLFPKKMVLKGTSPKVMLQDEDDLTDSAYSVDTRNKLFYYHQLNRYNKRITNLSEQNHTRIFRYSISLYLAYAILLGTIILFLYKLSLNTN